ncbi:hypothetical protein ACT453_43850, partial [Bacillus sp. D-CC]
MPCVILVNQRYVYSLYDFPTPSLVKEAAKRAITENYTSYTHNAGLLELRKAACNFVKDNY